MATETITRPQAAAEDWTAPQKWSAYALAKHAIWDHLYACQTELETAPDMLIATVLPGDRVTTLDTQDYARSRRAE